MPKRNLYWDWHNCVRNKKYDKQEDMNHEKDWIQVQRLPLRLAAGSPHALPHVDQDGDVEEQGDEDQDHGAEDPGGQGGQALWVGRRGRQHWGEHVHQHLGDDGYDVGWGGGEDEYKQVRWWAVFQSELDRRLVGWGNSSRRSQQTSLDGL